MRADAPLPVVAPLVAPPARPGARRSVATLAVAVALAGCVVAFSVLAVVSPPGTTTSWGRARFGDGTRSRLESLRDRLATGLVSLRTAAGDYAPGFREPGVDRNLVRRQSTATAVAALAAARRMGSRVAGLDEAIAVAKDVLTNRRQGGGTPGGPGSKPDRARVDATLAAGILALAWADDPADRVRLAMAATALEAELRIGPMATGWARGISTRAIVALVETGRADMLVDDPVALVQVDPEIDARVDCDDPRASDAFARVVAGGPGARDRATAVLSACTRADLLTWDGERTDLHSWVLQAWLAARVEGGDAWFERVLPLLEKAPDGSGVVQGVYYGDPVSRTAHALWILFEGWEAPPGKGA
jgi:hypothetical protein